MLRNLIISNYTYILLKPLFFRYLINSVRWEVLVDRDFQDASIEFPNVSGFGRRLPQSHQIIMPANLTKREIVLEIYEKTGFPQKEIVDTVQMTLDIVMRALSEGRNVELRNFGVLEVQRRKSRIGRNPNKPEAEVVIPERAVVKFKSGKILKQMLKKLDINQL